MSLVSAADIIIYMGGQKLDVRVYNIQDNEAFSMGFIITFSNKMIYGIMDTLESVDISIVV